MSSVLHQLIDECNVRAHIQKGAGLHYDAALLFSAFCPLCPSSSLYVHAHTHACTCTRAHTHGQRLSSFSSFVVQHINHYIILAVQNNTSYNKCYNHCAKITFVCKDCVIMSLVIMYYVIHLIGFHSRFFFNKRDVK